MLCPHKFAVSTGNKDEMACPPYWQLFKRLGETARDLSNQVSAFIAAMRQLPFRELVRVDYQGGQLYLDDRSQALRGPETFSEASQVWEDIAREFVQDAELLAERIDG